MIIRQGRAKGLFGEKGAEGRCGNVPNYIKEILKKKKKVKILEVGTGYGRALLELKQIFGEQIETYGVNLEKDWNISLCKKYALQEGFSSKDLPNKIYILDAAKKLPFKSGSFDFIFNPATMQYLSDKINFIEEVHRILTKEGIATLELEEYRETHPEEYQNLIEVWNKGGKRIDILNYLKTFNNIEVKKSKNRPWHYVLIKKTKKFNLDLKLIKAINLEEIAPSPIFWGTKSIYVIK
jgi:ubiquinone/menaquinone biosynthesis C-methylase UbiE